MATTVIKGVDVSKWQGANIDWAKVAASGIKFAIIRAGYGSSVSQKDPTFESNYARAKAAGLKVGAYWYSYATTTAGGKNEAATCLSCIAGKTFDLPVYFDQEYEPGILALTNAIRTAICKTFCEAIKAGGYEPGIYASSSFFQCQLNASELTNYHIWAAQYVGKCTCPIPYETWQYSSSGTVPGIPGKADMDYLYIDAAATTTNATTSNTTATTSVAKVTATAAAQKYDASLAGTYTVTANALNVRDGAGVSEKALVVIPKGTKVRNYGYYSMNGTTKWLYIQFTYNNITYTGFASSAYLKK